MSQIVKFFELIVANQKSQVTLQDLDLKGRFE